MSEDADALAFDRAPAEYRCSPFVEMRFVPDWAHTIARRVLYEAADEIRLRALMGSEDEAVAGLAAKIDREEAYHRMHAEMWHERLRDEPRYNAGARRALAVRARARRAGAARGARGALRARRVRAGRARHARGRLAGALGGDDEGAALRPGRVVVTETAVWEALAEVEDPEIPVISLVDLGVVRDVRVEGERVHVEFTPTFLGCPALEVMRSQMAEAIEAIGGEPDVEVVLDDSWSTDKITPEGREKLRAAGFAPPAPREASAPKLVQLQSNVFRCPYCGSTETKLENIFGPTPCRSIRYCASCRQPFEQFKTI